MIRKEKERLQALELRKKGKSIREIAKILNVSSSIVSLWVRDIILSPSQKQRLINKVFSRLQKGRRKAQKFQKQLRLKNKKQLEANAIKELGVLTSRDIFVIGIALYWGEGFRKDKRLGFATSDPAMAKFFLKWLRLAKVPLKDIRLRVGLNIGHKKRVKDVENYWSKQIGIPLDQFQKPFFQKFKLKKEFPEPEKYFGVLRIRANQQSSLFIKIQKWIEILRKAL